MLYLWHKSETENSVQPVSLRVKKIIFVLTSQDKSLGCKWFFENEKQNLNFQTMKKFYLVFALFLIIQCGFCQFSRMPLNYPHDAIAHLPSVMSIVDANTLWVGTWKPNSSGYALPYSNAVKSTDGGQTWQFYSVPITGSPVITDVEALDENTCYYMYLDVAGAGGGQIWKTSDGGATWSRKTTTQFFEGYPDFIHAFSQDTLIAVGDPTSGYFEVQISNDGGNTWTRVPQSNIPPLILTMESGVAGKSFGAIGSTIWFGTSRGRCFKSTDYGNHWTVSVINSDPVTFGWWYVSFSDLLHGIAYRANFQPPLYYLTSDGGTTWTQIQMLPGLVYPNVGRVPGINGGFVIAANATSGSMPTSVFFTNDFFTSLTKIDSGLHSYDNYIYFKDATTGWLSGAYGNDSTILKYNGVLTSVPDKKTISVNLTIVPNPSGQSTSITFPSAFMGHKKTMRITNISGKPVAEYSLKPDDQLLNLNSSNYSNGVYNIELISDDGFVQNNRWIVYH